MTWRASRLTGAASVYSHRWRLILGRLSVATTPADMNLPGLALHELQGVRKGTWAVKVSGNLRATFTLAGIDVTAVDYEDYH